MYIFLPVIDRTIAKDLFNFNFFFIDCTKYFLTFLKKSELAVNSNKNQKKDK